MTFCFICGVIFHKDTQKCVAIKPPKDGAVACDNWLGGEFCQAQCKNGTEMSGFDLGRLFVCQHNGEWSHPATLKPCKGWFSHLAPLHLYCVKT